MHVVVVESPAKAKTVQQYLGGDYRVLASWGHVRDLPAKNGSVKPNSGFAMTYASGPRARRVLGRIRTALKGADSLILATDPDREGEAIAWQVLTWLQERDAIGERPVRRVAFHEITPAAVRAAMAEPRGIDMDLVHAQQARRALDYLVGFHLSPVLWRKLPGSRSAGRVQSVALRLICEREAEIEAFVPREYWTIEARVMAHAGGTFTARLSGLDGVELGSLALESGTMAQQTAERIRSAALHVEAVEQGRTRRSPTPPFTTSTLQQEASRKLGFGVRRTMRIAQALYEGVEIGDETLGLISYMRTDSVRMSQSAAGAARRHRPRALRQGLPARPGPCAVCRDRERAGGARGHQADRLRAHAGNARGPHRRGRGAALRSDLEARGGEQDGGCAVRSGAGRARIGGGGHRARCERFGGRVRRLPPRLSRGRRRRCGR